MSEKRKMPVGSCTKCCATTFNMNRINERCHHRYDGKPCKGVFGTDLETDEYVSANLIHRSLARQHYRRQPTKISNLS